MANEIIAIFAPTVQAWSAVAIAVLTAALVIVTILYVRQTARIAKYTEATAESAERSLLLESMPIVLPAAGSASRSSGQVINQVRLRNTGRHAAVNGVVSVSGQSGLTLGPMSVLPIPSGEEFHVAFPNRE
jgi:hypothetical protein